MKFESKKKNNFFFIKYKEIYEEDDYISSAEVQSS